MLSILLLLAGPATAAPPAKPICQPTSTQPVTTTRRAGPHKLGEEPPARAFYTVVWSEDGCSKPVTVSERRYGAAKR